MLNSNGITGTTGTSPSDMALSNNSRFLYARNGVSNSISMFEVQASGSLTGLGTVSGLPVGSVGLAAK
jgi:6-phosphogluconolactonase (cycloisomerase 2 family)